MARVSAAARSALAREASAPGRNWLSASAQRRARQHLAALRVGLGGGDRLLRASHGQKRVTHCALHIKFGDSLVGAGTNNARFRGSDGGGALFGWEPFDFGLRADRTAPDTLGRFRRQDRPGDGGEY
jgi:hypothetical protein